MFWRVWRIVTGLLFISFFIICFGDNCAFIYHNDNTAHFTIYAELTVLFGWLVMALIDIFFGE